MSQAGPTQAEIDASGFWFHTVQFPNGLTSQGVKSKDVLEAEREIVFKHSIADKTVLDIGAWNGYFSFEARKYGASRIKALDYYTWNDPKARGRETFDFAKRYLAPEAEAQELETMQISAANVGVYDVVFFLGVLYHLKHPLYVLERVAEVCGQHLILETHLDATDTDRPMMAFYPDGFAGDISNWCGPNPACVRGMLQTVGFKSIETIPHPLHPVTRAFFHAFK